MSNHSVLQAAVWDKPRASSGSCIRPRLFCPFSIAPCAGGRVMGGREGARARQKETGPESWHFRQFLSSWPLPPTPHPHPLPWTSDSGARLPDPVNLRTGSPRPYGVLLGGSEDTEPEGCCLAWGWFRCALGLPDCADEHSTSCLDLTSSNSLAISSRPCVPGCAIKMFGERFHKAAPSLL